MLGAASFIAFIPVSDLAAARRFYGDTLGLAELDGEDAYSVVYDAAGTMLRVTLVADVTPQSFTIAGWRVPDITATLAALAELGVEATRFEGVEQDEHGVWATDDGDRIAWFSDPDGNVLSLTEFAQGVVDDYWR